jgi:sulfate adenylyltransferase
MSALVPPHGGELVDRLDAGADGRGVRRRVQLDDAARTDLENLAVGALSPLTGFMDGGTALQVATRGRLPGGLPWTMPVLLPVAADEAPFPRGERVALAHGDEIVGYLDVAEDVRLPPALWAYPLFGTEDPSHPGLARALAQSGRYLAGEAVATRIRQMPLRLGPRETRRLFAERGWRTVAAFQTRNVPHLGHEFVQKMAALQTDGLLIHPVLGEKKAGDFRDEVILAAYRALVDGYHRPDRTVLATMAYTMRYAGPKEAIHHAIVRKNFGASHFCVGRDHAGVGAFYDPLAAQREFARYPDLGVTPVPFGEVHLCLRCGGVVAADTCPHGGDEVRPFSGTRLRRLLTEGGPDLEELVRPEVAAVVRSFSRPFVAGAR